jgi:transcriptional regulator with XRE-family HTH domain
MRFDIFDQHAEALGASSDAEKAALIGVDRITLWRYRTGRQNPTLERAMYIAERIGCDLHALFPKAAA